MWRESVKALYRVYAKKGAGDMADGDDDEQVEAEFTQQRQYMERALEALKTRVGRTEDKTRLDFQKKVGENTLLINECNALRTENKDLKAQMSQLHSELQLQGRHGSQPPPRRAPSAGALRPSGSPGVLTAGLRPDSSGSRGQLLKGSASMSGRERAKVAEMLVAQVRCAAPCTLASGVRQGWAGTRRHAPRTRPLSCLRPDRIKLERKSKCSAQRFIDSASRCTRFSSDRTPHWSVLTPPTSKRGDRTAARMTRRVPNRPHIEHVESGQAMCVRGVVASG